MNINQIITLLIGASGIALTYWFFFSKKVSPAQVTGSSISVKVDAGYSPSNIIINKNSPVTLKITRTDTSDCLGEIVLSAWNIKKYLPLNKEINIDLSPKDPGEYPFHCGMNMFHGKITVK